MEPPDGARSAHMLPEQHIEAAEGGGSSPTVHLHAHGGHVDASDAVPYWFFALLGTLLAIWIGPAIYSRFIAPALHTRHAELSAEQREQHKAEALARMAAQHEEVSRAAKEKLLAKQAAQAEEEAKRLAIDERMPGAGRVLGPGSGAGAASSTSAVSSRRVGAVNASGAGGGGGASSAPAGGTGRAATATASSNAASGAAGRPATATAAAAASPPPPAAVAIAKPAIPTKKSLEAAAADKRALALERLWPEPPPTTAAAAAAGAGAAAADGTTLTPTPSGSGICTIVFRVHDWRGETRIERRFPEDAPLHALLDCVHALCPGGLGNRQITTVHPRTVVGGWDDFDLSKTSTVEEVEEARQAWRKEKAKEGQAGAAAGCVCPPTALPSARASIASLGLKGRATLLVRLTEANQVHSP